jgi:hypothetical protein
MAQNKYDTATNYVMPDMQVQPIETSLIRRQDVVEANTRMIEAYQAQQRSLLAQVQGETVGGHGGFLSNADQVRERRKTSGMYLRQYTFVSALTMGGLAYLATLAGADNAAAIAGWLFGTGALSLLLAWRRHGDEFTHSPEGIARHLLDWHGDIASYEAETRRKAIAWEHQAELRRQQATERAAEQGRQLAQLRIDELDARRKAIVAQSERRTLADWRLESAQLLQEERGEALEVLQVQSIQDALSNAPGASSTVLAGQSWQAALLAWVASLYDDGATTEAGVIKGRVLWSARSSWTEADKAAAKRVCCEMRPALIVAGDGGRWRLRREMFGTADLALQVLSSRLA